VAVYMYACIVVRATVVNVHDCVCVRVCVRAYVCSIACVGIRVCLGMSAYEFSIVCSIA